MDYNDQEQQLPVEKFGEVEFVPQTQGDAQPPSPPVLAYFGLGNAASVSTMSRNQLIEALHDQNWFVRVAALRKLQQEKQSLPIDQCVAALHDEHQAVRAAAVRALGQSGTQMPVAAVSAALYDASWQVRAAAVCVLGEQQEHAPIEQLISAFHDEDASVRVAASAALGKLGDRAPLDPLLEAIHDPEWGVREATLLALGSFGTRVPRNVLIEATKDVDSTVREAASEILDKIYPEFNKQELVKQVVDGYKENTGVRDRQEKSIRRINPGNVALLHLIGKVADKGKDQNKRRSVKRTKFVFFRNTREPSDKQDAPGKRTIWQEPVFRVVAVAAVLMLVLASFALNAYKTTPPSNPSETTIFQRIKDLSDGMARISWSPSSPSGTQSLAYMDDNGMVHVWDTNTDKYLSSYGPFPGGLAINWLSTGINVASLRTDGTVQLTLIGKIASSLMPTLGITGIQPLSAWSPDGSRFAIAFNKIGDNTIQICGTSSYHCTISVARSSGTVIALAWSPDGREIAAASEDGKQTTIEMWDADSGKSVIPSVSLPTSQLVALSWSADDQNLAYLLADGSIHILSDNANTVLSLSTAGGSDGGKAPDASWRGALAWSPDGQLLASTTPDGEIQIWDTSAKNLLTTYRGQSTQISTMVWSPDGTHLASVGINGKVLIWKTDKQDTTPQTDAVGFCETDDTKCSRIMLSKRN
jgi:hypothetical protein